LLPKGAPDLTPDDERAASLIRGFEFGASLADTLHDEIRDIADGETEVVHLMDAVVKALDEIKPQRSGLVGLLDHADPSARSLAGAYLIDLMLERVTSVLEVGGAPV
jgi:hypothetical protein